MRRLLGLVLLPMLAAAVSAQTAIVSDAFINGRVIVGTATASTRMTVSASSASAGPVFQVSGVDFTPFLRVANDGTVGLSTYSAAHLDVMSSGDSGAAALQLRGGNLYGGGTNISQIAFGANGTTSERHAVNSVHLSSAAHNSLDFRIWTPDAGTANIATMTVLSLVTISTASGASMHVRPVGDPVVELVVSDGGTTGGGTIHVANQVTPSSRKFKTDISYLDDAERAQAYETFKSLKPVSFRYMKRKGTGYVRDRDAPVRRGLLYEESPQELRGPGDSLSLDQRLLESEMAFQEFSRRLERLEKEVGK